MLEELKEKVCAANLALVRHGLVTLTWGRTVEKAVENAVVLEEVAKIAAITVALNPSAQMNPALVEKHYSRKHGPNAYYGQIAR